MKLLVVHSHPLLAVTLAALMQRCGACVRVVGAATVHETLRIASHDRECAGAFVDVGTTCEEAAAAVRELARRGVPAIAMSASPAHLRTALECGAAACISCDVDADALLSALLVLFAREGRGARLPREAIAFEAPSRCGALTDRQRAVLRQLCAGDANKDIGRELRISEKTVKTHLSAIFKALGVSNRTQAVVAAREAHLEF